MTVHYLPVPTPAARGRPRVLVGHEEFARRCGLHPDLVRRFVALGLVPAVRDVDGALWFDPSQVAAVARLQRLRAGLPLNYSALGLVCDLLDRITELETALRVRGHTEPVRSPPAPRSPATDSPRH
ncbi:chaperone modulator CbpM [Geodermatophilus ruber]|uniref:MerR HTH family regulatory protein n=1 Tax=Geodermatophilus ruber TaxID=504800 RepID=A0A1I4AB47_9ACTN|nr:chaperone modulator CbpM [Geodermatophilus ruber]SFK53615.1 MerR HTH family regulatory protein [Geodermatophilus ruber]